MIPVQDARQWVRAVEFAELELEALRLESILSEPDLSEVERPIFEKWLEWKRAEVARLLRVLEPPPREMVDEWKIPPETIQRIWDEIESHPELIAELFTRFLVPDLTWPPGARKAKADCPFCRGVGAGHLKKNFELELSTSRWLCWCCPDKKGNLRTALRAYSGLRFRDLMKELGAYVGIVITDPAPRRRVAL